MSSTIPPPHDDRIAAPRLTIQRPDGSEFSCEIDFGNGIIVGADSTCGLHLEGEGVAALHCMIRHENGRIIVKDWYTVSGTFIDETKIDAETVLPTGAVIRVGQFRMTVDAATEIDVADELESSDHRAAESLPETSAPLPIDDSSAGGILDAPNWLDEDADGREPFAAESSTDVNGDFGFADNNTQEEIDPETFALLKSEVEYLQNEIAERDSRLEELMANGDERQSATESSADVDASETAALIDRLEQLLDELNQSDARMSTMEEMLRLAEDANVAEQEERKQLEAWVGEIESRVGEREAEWAAEMEVSQQRVEEITAERDRAESRLSQAGSSPEAQAEFQRTISQVREQANVLRDALEESRQKNSNLESQIENLSGRQAEETFRRRVDEALREERLQTVEEQATLARERAEISRLKMEMERAKPLQTAQSESPNDVDIKFRAFREHLKEIQEQEVQERKQRGLIARLSNLWKRLEGR